MLYKIPRGGIGENQSFVREEKWLAGHGVPLVVMQDVRCMRLMREFMQRYPRLWAEDIGE